MLLFIQNFMPSISKNQKIEKVSIYMCVNIWVEREEQISLLCHCYFLF